MDHTRRPSDDGQEIPINIYLRALILCFRYAWPCAGKRLDSGKMDPDTYEALMSIFAGERLPNEVILQKAFPKMCAAITVRSQRLSIEPWTLENVAPYWLVEHRHEESPVILGTVLSAAGEGFWNIRGCDKTEKRFLAHNAYDLPLQDGNLVTVHNDTVIEIVDSRTLACYAGLGFGA